MEWLIVVLVLGGLAAISFGGLTGGLIGLLGLSLYLLRATRNYRCPQCGKHPVPIENILYCTRCGEIQKETHNDRKRFLWSFALSTIWCLSLFGGLTLFFFSAYGIQRVLEGARWPWGILLLSLILGPMGFWISGKIFGIEIRVLCRKCHRLLRDELSVRYCGCCGMLQ